MNRPGCLHTFVGARLPANVLANSMHQDLAKCISQASALLKAINHAPGLQAGPATIQARRCYGGYQSLRIGREGALFAYHTSSAIP
jgi:hypothetical protein